MNETAVLAYAHRDALDIHTKETASNARTFTESTTASGTIENNEFITL
ncbi:hypothetical protein [Nocardia alni]|nr:hypothetical protein [Nocardia alni]